MPLTLANRIALSAHADDFSGPIMRGVVYGQVMPDEPRRGWTMGPWEMIGTPDLATRTQPNERKGFLFAAPKRTDAQRKLDDDLLYKAGEISHWVATTLSAALASIMESGIPFEQLWLEHEGTETRIMMGPCGLDSDTDLRTMLGRVWQESSLDHCKISLHYEGPEISVDDLPRFSSKRLA